MNPAIIKAAGAIKQKYDAIPPEKKRRARNIIVIIVFIALFHKKIGNAIRLMFHKDINKLDVDTGNLTYPKSEYYSMCSTLEAAMDGTGTQDSSVKDVFTRIKTQDDWNFLQKAFGIRKKDGGTFFADITGDLKMWLSDDLDESEMGEITNTLKQQGITY